MGKLEKQEKTSRNDRSPDREEFARMALAKAIDSKKSTEAWGQFSVKLTWKAGVLQTVDIIDQIVYK